MAFRVSKPGRSIWSSNLDDYLLYEGMAQASMTHMYNVLTLPCTSFTQGSVTRVWVTSTGPRGNDTSYWQTTSVNSTAVWTWAANHGLSFTPAIVPLSYGANVLSNSGMSLNGYKSWVDSTNIYLQFAGSLAPTASAFDLTLQAAFPIGLLSVQIQ